MITGIHAIVFSPEAEKVRVFFADVLGLSSADAGGGWLIFAMPPAEAAIHPVDGEFSQGHGGHQLLGAVLYLMVDDLNEYIATLKKKGVQCSEIEKADWGVKTTIPMPSGGEIGLYEPRHPTALDLKSLVSRKPKSRTSPSKKTSPKRRPTAKRATSRRSPRR